MVWALAVALLPALLGVSTPGMSSWMTASAHDERLGAWIPRYPGDVFEDYRNNAATRATKRDRIVYGGDDRRFGGGPRDGRFFWHGSAGPPRGWVVYDAAHRLAYAGEGCCAWFQDALAVWPQRPPRSLPTKSLISTHTALGVRLGMTPHDVRGRVGSAPLRPLHTTGLVELSYVVPDPESTGRPANTCIEALHYVFRRARLALISLTSGC